MEWHPAGWSVCLPLLIFPCTIKSRSSLLAPAHRGGPGRRAVIRLWYFGGWYEEWLICGYILRLTKEVDCVETCPLMTLMMIVIASGQTNLPKGHIAATYRQFTRIRQASPMCTPSNTCFLEPSRVHVPNSISIGSAIFAESPYTLQWAAHFPPQNCSFTSGDIDRHLISGSVDPPKSTF